MSDNEGLTNPADYMVDVFIDQLDRNGETIKSYTLRSAYPDSVGDITLGYGETEIETFDIIGLSIFSSQILLLKNQHK